MINAIGHALLGFVVITMLFLIFVCMAGLVGQCLPLDVARGTVAGLFVVFGGLVCYCVGIQAVEVLS